jgi:hypothetical protein
MQISRPLLDLLLTGWWMLPQTAEPLPHVLV